MKRSAPAVEPRYVSSWAEGISSTQGCLRREEVHAALRGRSTQASVLAMVLAQAWADLFGSQIQGDIIGA